MMNRLVLCIGLFSLGVLGIEVSAGRCFTMSPEYDVYLLAGKGLQLNCSLKVLSNGSDCVQDYRVNQTRILKGNQPLPSDIFDYHVEEKTLAMTIRNVTVNDSGTYNCRYGDTNSIQSFRPVHIGEPPGKPDLTCVSQNWDNLRCSFSLSRQPVNMLMNWTMEYRMFMGQGKVICSNSDSGIICDPCPERIWGQMSKYNILIEGVNENYDLQVKNDFTVKANSSIVKPNPVSELGFNNEDSRVQLYWDGPRGLTVGSSVLFPMDYKITVTSKWDNRIEMLRNALEKHQVLNLTDFIPFANCTVTVQAKPTTADRDIYWSDGSTVNFETPSKVSEHSVTMTTGSYMLLDCGQHVMCPILYWKNPARKFWNGPITGYRVIVEEFQVGNNVVLGHINKSHIGSNPVYRLKRLIEPSSENITGMSVSGALKTTMMKNEDYSIEIMLINSEGVSASSSTLLIPNWTRGQTLKPVWVSVETDDSSVYVSWYIDPMYCAEITTVSYYWCLLDTDQSFNSTYVSCKENVDWLTFNITDACGNETAHKIGKSHDFSDVKYAVSVEADGVSGGLIWETFRFDKQDVPEKPLYSVNAEGTSLIIKIQYGEYYSSEGGRPEHYSVFYSECLQGKGCSSDGDVKKKFTANFTNPVYTIKDLKPGSQYTVYVTSENRFGKSIDGDLEYRNISAVFPASGNTSKTAKILGAVFGSFAAIFVVIVVIILYRKKHKKWSASSNIKIPEMDEAAMLNGSFTRTDSEKDIQKMSDDHDSGKGSNSPGSSLVQIDPLQQQNGVIGNGEVQPNVSSLKDTDSESDQHQPVLGQQKMSPSLLGYRKNVLRCSSNGQCSLEMSDDESDEEFDISGENKENLKVSESMNVVPKPEQVSVIDLNRSNILISNENNVKNTNLPIDSETLSGDYSVAAIHKNQNGDVNCTKLPGGKFESNESSRDKLVESPVFELIERGQNCANNLNTDETKEITVDSILVGTDHVNKHVENNFAENSNPHISENLQVIDENLECLDSDGNEIGALSDLEENDQDPMMDSPYKNPDQISLGDGSTVSDVSDSESTTSDNFSDRIEDKGLEIDNSEEDKKKFDSALEDGEEKQNNAEASEKIHDFTLANSVKGTAMENECSGNTGRNEIMSEESRSTSEPASLEPYIRYGSNGFVKSPKLNDEELKKVASLKLSQKPKNSDTGSNIYKEDTQMSKF